MSAGIIQGWVAVFINLNLNYLSVPYFICTSVRTFSHLINVLLQLEMILQALEYETGE
jgi:hypothetical protein